MHGKLKLKLENYRDRKCVTQTAWMTRTNEYYKSESMQIKSIQKQTKKKNEKYANETKVYDWKNVYETKLYE